MKIRPKEPTFTSRQVVVLAISNGLRERDDLAQDVVNTAILHYPSASLPVRRLFEKMLREQSGTLKVPGFHDASKALKEASTLRFLVPYVLRKARSVPILETLLALWEDAKPAMRQSLHGYLVTSQIPVRAGILSDDLVGEWNIDQALQVARDFVTEYPEYTFDEAALMLFCQAALVPLNGTTVRLLTEPAGTPQEQKMKETEGVEWEEWLAPWRKLPCDAPEWGALDAFLGSLRQLAEEKHTERQAVRHQLEADLTSLLYPPPNSERSICPLAFFDLSGTHWQTSVCPATEIIALTAAIQGLTAILDNYATVYRQSDSDAAARRKKNRILESLEEEIQQHFVRIDRVLSVPPPPDTGPEASETPTPESEEAFEVYPKPPPAFDHTLADTDDANRSEESTSTVEKPSDLILDAPASSSESDRIDLPYISSEEITAPDGPDESQEEGVLLCTDSRTLEEAPSEGVAAAQSQDFEPPSIVDMPVPSPDPGESAFVWDLMENEDYTGAFALARALEEHGQASPVCTSLLAVYQGAQWLRFETVRLRDDIQSVALGYVPQEDADSKLIGLAGALLPAILSHNNLFSSWLAGHTEYGAVGELFEAVREFTLGNQALRPVDCLDSASPVKREITLQDVANRANRWLQEARSVNHDIIQARKVWERLLKSDGELNRLLTPVGANRKDEVATVRQMLAKMERREDIQKIVIDIGRGLHRGRDMILAGDRRDAVVRDFQEAVALARDWCALVEQEQRQDKNWFSRLTQNLLAQLRSLLPRAYAELETQKRDAVSVARRVATGCLQQALHHMADALSLTTALPSPPANIEAPSLDWWVYDELGREETLTSALNRRLLWLPELELHKDLATKQVAAPLPLEMCTRLPIRPVTLLALETALEQWRQEGDFRFDTLILSAFREEEHVQSLRSVGEKIRQDKRTDLQEKRDKAIRENERALRDGVLLDEEYTHNDEDLKAVVPEALNARQEMARVRAIAEKIAEARRRRSLVQQQLWSDLQDALAGTVDPAVWNKILHFVQKSLNRHDVRVTDAILSELRACLAIGQPPDASWLDAHLSEAVGVRGRQSNSRSPLEDFMRLEKQITEALRDNPPRSLTTLLQALEQQRSWNGLEYPDVLPERLKEASQAVSEWKAIKEKRASSIEQKDLTGLESLLTYLGFARNRTSDPLRVRNQDRDWIHVTAQMTAGEESVRSIPQFGSMGERDGYHIVCFWDRLEAVGISARLESLRLNSESVLIFYFGSLSLQQRLSFAEMARKRKLSFAVLDETLLAFLALQRDNRLRAFLRCTLPFSAPNPYTPDRAGAVPGEMFYGRSDMVARLMDPNGSCIVYGGRQLGKSALLVDTQRRFHQPEQHRYAWIEDIRLTGASSLCIQKPETIYRRLFERFAQNALIKGPVPATREGLLRQIRESLISHPELRVLIMFDEADNFLEADAAQNFPTVTTLRQLMDDTNRRFKVVFAGLHHVQRFRHYSNQPLTHFGSPILVGPLAPQDAQQLVREPLESLGFRLSDAEVMRVLSHTNRHPGLIQKYCFELLRKLHNTTRHEAPPTPVPQNTVEAVYLDQEVRSLIATRFEDTLNLDDRYRMIAYTMVVEQMSERDSYAHVYHDQEILAIVQDYASPASPLFGTTNSDGMRILLEEMCGLGVLIHVHDQSGYRLRSPNLVRLLGTEQTIFQRLVELAAKPQQTETDSESLHAPLHPDLKIYSPLTRVQETGLNAERSGVCLIFASEAQGLALLPETLKALLPEEWLQDARSRAHLEPMPHRYTGEAEVKQWLTQITHSHRSVERLIVFQNVAQNTGLDKRVRTAQQFCEDYAPRSASAPCIQIFFLLDPEATAGWLSLPPSLREALENAATVCTWPRIWSTHAIRQRLLQLELAPDAAESVMNATGGWQILVETFFQQRVMHSPQDDALQMRNELDVTNSILNADFRRKVGISLHSPAWRVWSFIHREQSDTGLEPELIDVENLTPAECESSLLWLERMGCLTRQNEMVRADRFLSERFAGELR